MNTFSQWVLRYSIFMLTVNIMRSHPASSCMLRSEFSSHLYSILIPFVETGDLVTCAFQTWLTVILLKLISYLQLIVTLWLSLLWTESTYLYSKHMYLPEHLETFPAMTKPLHSFVDHLSLWISQSSWYAMGSITIKNERKPNEMKIAFGWEWKSITRQLVFQLMFDKRRLWSQVLCCLWDVTAHQTTSGHSTNSCIAGNISKLWK